MNGKIKLLGHKITNEYHISTHDYSESNDPIEIIISAYEYAEALFDVDSENSIFTQTITFYMKHIDEALESFTCGMDNLIAATSLLQFFAIIQEFVNNDHNSLIQMLISELKDNKDYYKLFTLDYFLELTRTEGLDAALSELEYDVNIRASTYYNAAYSEYLRILPGFEEIINKYLDID